MLKTEVELSKAFELDSNPLSLREYNDIAHCRGRISFQPSPALQSKLSASVAAVAQAVENNKVVYGINTGFGAMANQPISCEDAVALQNNLLSFLAAGAGPDIDAEHVRGAMLLRANVLLQGKSGARIELVERLIEFLNRDAIPVVRQFGSIGASGDLIPLSTIARAITGNGNVEVRLGDRRVNAKTALNDLGLDPIELQPKEGLALVNGTSFSAAVAANATNQARNLLAVSFAAQSMMMAALRVDVRPFEEFVHQAKPHPGQVWSANMMRRLLPDGFSKMSGSAKEVQDCYSLRCFPQYTGGIVENIANVARVVEIEMNGVSDNPLVDPESGRFYQSGNFLGQYIATAMDGLRRDIGLLAKHLDVQIALLVSPEFNRGLSASLRGNDERPYNMGLKGLQICANSLMPMLTYFGQPLTHHFPTHAEQYNQNINGLSWGSANLAWDSVKMFSQYLATSLLSGIQALDLRAFEMVGHFDGSTLLGSTGQRLYLAIHQLLNADPDPLQPFLFNDEDRWLEKDIETIAENLFAQGELISAVKPILESYSQEFEGSR